MLKQIILSVALCFSLSAQAVNTDLGVLGVGAKGFGNIFPAGAAAFLDTFTFSLASASSVTGNAGAEGIDAWALVLRDSDGDTVGVDASPGSFTFALLAGDYSLGVIGLGADPGAFYGGRLATLVAAPIPEPETYALMLAGLAAVGFLARRRGG